MKTILFYLRSTVLWLNYLLGRYKVTYWLIGSARSGTTWITSLLNYDDKLRELFEPFHPEFNNRASFLKTRQYISPSDNNPQLDDLARDIFSGNFYNMRADRASKRLFYNGIVVKDIVSNLYAGYLSKRFPSVKIVLLLRNPFSVAFSKYEIKEWNWASYEFEELLEDNILFEEHLMPFKVAINDFYKNTDYIVRSILFWCIFNYVPLKQFKKGDVELVLYEEFLLNPETSVSNLRQNLGLKNPIMGRVSMDKIERPSVVTSKKGNFRDNVSSWKSKITPLQLEKCLEVLKLFGMHQFYNDNGIPNRKAILEFMGE